VQSAQSKFIDNNKMKNNMKKFLVVMLSLIPTQSFAAGPYDGIWEIKPYGYAIVTENNNEMIIVAVYNDDYGGDWVASSGNPRTIHLRHVASRAGGWWGLIFAGNK
jgi:hypothetical protein